LTLYAVTSTAIRLQLQLSFRSGLVAAAAGIAVVLPLRFARYCLAKKI
jgi:hypothetical protein